MSLFKLHEMQTGGKLAKASSLVIKVTHHKTKADFALKRMQRDDYLKHISDVNELILTKRCSLHPNIIQIYGFAVETRKINGVETYSTNFLMKLWDRNLAEELGIRSEKGEFYTKEQFVEIAKTLISVLCYLQKQSVAHRDVKPENIMTKQTGEICLIDFSEAIWLNNETKFECTTLVGSPYYMSPELKESYINGAFSPIEPYNPWKSDVFSLGMTLLDIGSLSVGDRKKLPEKLHIVEEKYGRKLKDIIEQMLEKNPKKRSDLVGLEHEINFETILREDHKTKDFLKKKEDRNLILLGKKTYAFFEKMIREPKVKQVQNINEIVLVFDMFKGIETKNNRFSV